MRQLQIADACIPDSNVHHWITIDWPCIGPAGLSMPCIRHVQDKI